MTARDPGAKAPRLPAIHLSAEDHSRLSTLIGDLPARGGAGLLQQELARAVLHGARRRVPTVGLDRWVHYVDERGREPRRVKIVMPEQADIDQGLISPLSHVGAGLLGLAEGATMHWSDPSGRLRALTPVLIEDPLAPH